MEISVSAKVILDLGGTESRRVTGELVGWKSTDTIFVTIPLLTGIRDYMEAGRYITCRYMHEGIVYGFKSRILGYLTNPESLVFLSYPDSWETIELRQQERLPCFFPASFTVEDNATAGILKDISELGCRILCGPSREKILENITLGSETIIRFLPFGAQSGYNIPALIVNASTDNKKITGVGFKFPRIAEKFQKDLKEYIIKIQEHSL